MKKEQIEEQVENQEQELQEQVEETQTPTTEELEARIAELEDKNLRMMAEFDNYRRRTNKEKLDLMATAGEGIFKEMLPLIDDAAGEEQKGKVIDCTQRGYKLGDKVIRFAKVVVGE